MWRAYNIATVCRQCLPVAHQRVWRSYYSTGKGFEIGGIYSGVHSSTPQAPFLKALKDVQKGSGKKTGDKGGKRRDEAKQGKRDGNRKDREEEEELKGNRKGRTGGWGDKMKLKKKGDKAMDEASPPVDMLKKKKKVEQFVIHKAKPKTVPITELENMMFVRRKRVSSENVPMESVTPVINGTTIKSEMVKTTNKVEKKTNKDERKDYAKVVMEPRPLENVSFTNSMFKKRPPVPEPEEFEEEEAMNDMEEDEMDEEAEVEPKQNKEAGGAFVKHAVQQSEYEMRIDRWAGIHLPSVPRSHLQKMLRTRLISYSVPEEPTKRKKAKSNMRLKQGYTVFVPSKLSTESTTSSTTPVVPKLRLTDAEIEVIKSWVVHKDEHLLIINKPEGLPVQGGTKVGRHLVQLLPALRMDKEEDPRLVHRLDRDTSGALVLARTRDAAAKLAELFKSNRITKIYWALIAGVPKFPIGRINMPLEKTGARGEERIVPREQVTKTAKSATTDFSVVEELEACSFVVLTPNTGRTHQLRVHCASGLGAHIVGDQKYGDGQEGDKLGEILEGSVDKLHLHARRIIFTHPFTNERINVATALPPHMLQTWQTLGLKPNYKEKLSQTGENPDIIDTPTRRALKTYGNTKNVRKSIWSTKASATPIKDMKMKAAAKKYEKQKRRPPSKNPRLAKKEKEASYGRKKTRNSVIKDRKYRSERRARPVRRLAPKVRK